MSKDKKPNPLSGDAARKIWLAGIGAYGRAFSEAQEGLAKVTKGGGKMFDELVQKGEVIETMVSYKGKEMAKDAKDMAKDAMDKVGDFDMDERIAKMRSRLKRSGDDGDTGDIEDRLDAIEAKLDAVLKMLKPKPAPRKRPAAKKKPAAKKAPAKRAKK